MTKNKVIYEDDNWVIQIINDGNINPSIKISAFKDFHFVDDLELSREVFCNGMTDKIKYLIYI